MLVAPMMFRAPHVLCEAGLLDAPVGGGPPASRTCCVLLLVAPLVFRAPSGPPAPSTPAVLVLLVRCLDARPGPAAAHGCRSQALPPPSGAAAWSSGPSGAPHIGGGGGFAPCEAL